MSTSYSFTATVSLVVLLGAPLMVACHAVQTTISELAVQEAEDHEVMDRALEVMNDESLSRQERAEVISRSLPLINR